MHRMQAQGSPAKDGGGRKRQSGPGSLVKEAGCRTALSAAPFSSPQWTALTRVLHGAALRMKLDLGVSWLRF